MTVEELIEEIEGCDPDTNVGISVNGVIYEITRHNLCFYDNDED